MYIVASCRTIIDTVLYIYTVCQIVV